MRKEEEPVVIDQIFQAPIDSVWESITRIDRMRQWYFEDIPSFEPDVGFETRFHVRSGGRNFLHLWRVTEVDPPKRIAYSWKYGGYPGDSHVVFELFEEGDATRLRLTHHIDESFPDDIPEFERASCVEGWNYFIGQRLREFLE